MLRGTSVITLYLYMAVVSASPCSPGFEQFEQNCYAYVRIPETWINAQSMCRAMGGRLAEVTSHQQNAYIKGIAFEKQATLWLGATDVLKEDTWLWASGNPVNDFTDWHSGQPDTHSDKDENCMEMYLYDNNNSSGTWNDDQCDKKRAFVCQKLVGDVDEIVG